MRTVCWAAVVAMSSACAAGHVDRERPVRDAAGSAGFGATQDTGEPPPETLPVAGQGDLEPDVGDGPAAAEASAASDGSAGTSGEFAGAAGSDAAADGSSPASEASPSAAPSSAPAMAPPPLFPPPSAPADRIPSPDNPVECPDVAPADPWGPCAGLPVYLTCDYGSYHCVCDWIHWICVG